MSRKFDPVAGLNAVDLALESQRLDAEQEEFVRAVLPLLDNVERLCRGLESYEIDQLMDKREALSFLPDFVDRLCIDLDLERFGAAGEETTPELFDVADTVVDAEKPLGTVVEVIRYGWRFRGRLLQQARVTATIKTEQNIRK